MTYVVAGLIVIWFCGLLFLAGQFLNDLRLIYNNIAPGAQSISESPSDPLWKRILMGSLAFLLDFAALSYFWGLLNHFDRVTSSWIADPARLTETGLFHLKKATRHMQIAFAWVPAGVLLIIWASFYFNAS
jgi:hypothetical protein